MAADQTPRREDLLHLWNEVQLTADEVLGIDNGGTFNTLTCGEAEGLAGIFAAAGRQDVHDFIIDQHALGDYDPEDTHHDKYLEA